MKKNLYIFLIILIFCLGIPEVRGISLVHIVELQKQGKVIVESIGAGLNAVTVNLTRTTEEGIVVLIPAGTYFINKGNAQDMVSTVEVRIDLTKEKKTTIKVPAACANAYKAVPDSSSRFEVTYSPSSEELRKLMGVIGQEHTSEEIAQVTVWIVTDNIDKEFLEKRYRKAIAPRWPGITRPAASEEDILKAMQLLKKANIEISQKAICTKEMSLIYLRNKGASVVKGVMKIGYIDLQKVLNDSKAGQKAKKVLTELVAAKTKSVQEKAAEIRKLMAELKQAAALSSEAKKQKEEKLIRDYQRMLRDAQEEIREKENELNTIKKELMEIVKKVGEKEGYDIILEKFQPLCLPLLLEERQVVIPSDSSADNLTDIVIKTYDRIQ